MEGRGRARAGSRDAFAEPGFVLVLPDFLPRLNLIADDRFRIAALFLRDEEAVDDDHARPAGADALLPDLLGLDILPVRLDADAADHAVAQDAAELGPVARLERPRLLQVGLRSRGGFR